MDSQERTELVVGFSSTDLPYPDARKGVALVTLVYREPDIIQTVKAWKDALNIPIYIFADGVDDKTSADLEYLYLDGQIHLQMQLARKGYPRAMREAMIYMFQKTTYEKILVTDSDACYSIESLQSVLNTGADNISGYRVGRNEVWYRNLYIKMEKPLMFLLFGLRMQDFTAVCRLMNAHSAYIAASQCKYSKFGFWAEFDVYWLNAFGAFKEIPVEYTAVPTKIYSPKKLPKIIVQEVLAILKLRLHRWHII